MAEKKTRRWPDVDQRREFIEMCRTNKSNKYVCFEYFDGRTKLTSKALKKAIQRLAESIQVLLAVDLENSVIIASPAISSIIDDVEDLIIEKGMWEFFWEMAKNFPNNVAMVIIDRKGNFKFDPSFHLGA